MLYRVVIQGCAASGTDLEQVKREFVRVTALPKDVTDKLFDGTAKVLKRQVSGEDAERIAQTLRAIGAPTTVEPEPAVSGEADGAIIAAPPARTPLGTPTYSPATSPAPDAAPPAPPAPRTSRRKVVALSVLGAVLLAVLAAPVYDEWVRRMRSAGASNAPPKKAATDTEAAAPQPRVFKASALEGPWRCTDQSSGVSTYWEYRADGSLLYFGDNLTRTESPQSGPGIPTSWSLDGDRLTWTFRDQPPLTLVLTELSLIRLDYRNGALSELRCLRP